MRLPGVHSLPWFGYRPAAALVLVLLGATTSMLEGVGLAILLPLFSLMEQGPGASIDNPLMGAITDGFAWLGLPLKLEPLLLAVAVVVIVRQGMAYGFSVYRETLFARAEAFNRKRLFRRLLEARLPGTQVLPQGALLNAVAIECKRTGGFVNAALGTAIGVLKLIVYLGVCTLISWQATIAALVILSGILAIFASGILGKTREGSRLFTAANEGLSKYFAERLGLLRLIKVAGMEDTERRAFEQRADTLAGAYVQLIRLAARITAFTEPVVLLSLLALLYVTVGLLDTPLASMAVLMVVLVRLLPVTQEVLSGLQATRANSASVQKVADIDAFLTRHAEDATGARPFPQPLREGIVFDGVSFTYGAVAPPADLGGEPVAEPGADGRLPALSDVHLTIPAGRTTALVGPSGAGKTTLIDLIPRLNEPTTGRLLFDGIPAGEIALAELRGHVGMVAQEAVIFDGSLADNIRYGLADAPLEAVIDAARQANAHDFISAMPQGYDTLVGERGLGLSGGQKQRIALARAFLTRVPVLLLDEPTSALDAESELAVQKGLRRLRETIGTTVVIIAHRLSTITDADQVVVMDKGRVVAHGRHADLVRDVPWYSRVVALQTGAGEDAEAAPR